MVRTKRLPHTNRLLDDLPRGDLRRLLAECDPVVLVLGEALAQPGRDIEHVYFPTESFVSLVAEMGSGTSLEIALVGNEGMLGAPLVLGTGVSPVHAVVQGAGPAWRMGAMRFQRALAQDSGLRRSLHLYVHVLMTQLGQSAGCTRFHVVEQRLARWLLMTSDRAHSKAFHMTHEVLAYTLGVRRVGITKAATSLQKRKLISYSRGDISIRDRVGLEEAACSCYQADKDTYSDMMGR